eukprot:NODE_671_length_5354_cov_0.091722.p2 type:complete len:266 gc:universal NODE_671_length_5354_cov_0.091722:5154-4357(-)
MFFANFVAALQAGEPFDFKKLKNLRSLDLYNIAVSGNLTCGVSYRNGWLLYCWNTYDITTTLHQKKPSLLIKGISIYGKAACANSDSQKVYCTEDITADRVDWVKAYQQHSLHDIKVELDDDTVCITRSDFIKCTSFSNILSSTHVWEKKKIYKDAYIDNISISGERACVNILGRTSGKSVCTDDLLSTDSPKWEALDRYIFNVRINKDKICGKWTHNRWLTCYENGEWRTQKIVSDLFALDDTHIVLEDAQSKELFLAEFPKTK